MDWEQIERHFASHVTLGRGRPALAPRLAAGLLDRFAPVAAMQRLLPFGRRSRPHLVGLHPVIAPSAQRLNECPVREVLQSFVAT
jgi:hypothetical protein